MNPRPAPPPEPVLWIAGPCVLDDDPADALAVARALADLASRQPIRPVFKASFDKANRTRGDSPRGPGLQRGLEVLTAVRDATHLPLLTDIHEAWQADVAAQVVDVLQIPAFLCRQTDLIRAAAATGRVVNIKKGQFLAPDDVPWLVEKARDAGAADVWITERGTSFGYHRLVVDMQGLASLALDAPRLGFRLVFDATHAVQRPSADGGRSGGERRFVPPLLRAAAALGVRAFFTEAWPDPDRAPSDGPNALRLQDLEQVVQDTCAVCDLVARAKTS